jgi:hypothetical protein
MPPHHLEIGQIVLNKKDSQRSFHAKWFSIDEAVWLSRGGIQLKKEIDMTPRVYKRLHNGDNTPSQLKCHANNTQN